MFNKMVLAAALFTAASVQANNAPSYTFVQGSVERISQSGDDNFSDTGLGIKTSYQLGNNWFIAADWQRFTDKENIVDSFANERIESNLDLSLDRFYLGGGYLFSVSDTSNVSIAAYLGSYRYALNGRFSIFNNGQQVFSERINYSTTDNSLKTELAIRTNMSSQVELNGKVYFEFVDNSDLENKSQYGIAVGGVYKFSSQFAISAEAATGKLLDETTTQLALGIRYYF